MPPPTFDPRRLKTFFVAMHRANEGERSGAATVWYNYLIACHIHSDDIQLSVGNDLLAMNMTAIERLKTEIGTLYNENLFLRRHVDAATLQDALKSGKIAYQWYAFEDLVRLKFSNEHGDLPRHWRNLLSKHVEVTPYQLQRWERGVAPIPETVFEVLRALPDASTVKPIPQKLRHPRAAKMPKAPVESRDTYTWPPAVLSPVVSLWLKGGSRDSIRETAQAAARAHGDTVVISDGMINGKIDNSRVPVILEAAVRPAGEPIDWPELWLIGGTIFLGTNSGKRQRGWRTLSLRYLGLHTSFLPPADLNPGTTQERIDAFRNLYIQHNLRRETVKPVPDLYKPILDTIVAAGRVGATRDEIKRKLGTDLYRRFSELQKMLLIFNSGLERKDQAVYVAREFAEHHRNAWETAVKTYGNTR